MHRAWVSQVGGDSEGGRVWDAPFAIPLSIQDKQQVFIVPPGGMRDALRVQLGLMGDSRTP